MTLKTQDILITVQTVSGWSEGDEYCMYVPAVGEIVRS